MCERITAPDDINADKGTHTIMHAHHALGIVGDEGEAMLHAVEARLATIGQKIEAAFRLLRRKGEVVFAAQLSPVVLLRLGQHEDNLQGGGVLAETLDGAHQHRPASDGQELLGNV